jgi:Domain of unknown function (DUF4280)
MATEQNNALLEQKRAERKKKDEEDSPSEKRELVMDGAKLKCEFAQGLGTLKVTSNEILLQDKVVATVGDGNNMVNLQFQGTCGHPKWPGQNMSPPPCMSVIKLSPWQKLGTGFMQEQKVLVKESTITCTPDFNSAVATPIPKVASIVKKEEKEIVYKNGHFYNEDGTFEGKVDNPAYTGSANDVYTCTGKGKGKDKEGKEIEVFGGIKKLETTHEEFCYISGVIKSEDASNFETAAATTQATFNAVKFEKGDNISMAKQSEYAKKLLSLNSYSTATSKNALIDKEKESNKEVLNARKGLIHVLLSKNDFSEGAILWDGIDFADKGIEHNKATKDGGISITKTLWEEFVGVCIFKKIKKKKKAKKDKDKDDPEDNTPKLDYGKHQTKEEVLKNIPFETEKLENYETLGTGKFNKGRTLHIATVVKGRQIFWMPYKEHENNKGYTWKYFMNHNL